MPIRSEDVAEPGIRIFAKFPSSPLLEYKVSLCAITINVDVFSDDIQIDVAILVPKQSEVSLPHLVVNANSPELGDEVFMAGFPDELILPFQIDKILKKDFVGVSEFLDSMQKGYMADMTGPLIKRAVVGNIRRIQASNPSQTINCDVFYLDNGMHSGASGGPVVNPNGEVVGLITQRAITSASQLEDPNLSVPSGSTICISLTALLVLSQKAV